MTELLLGIAIKHKLWKDVQNGKDLILHSSPYVYRYWFRPRAFSEATVLVHLDQYWSNIHIGTLRNIKAELYSHKNNIWRCFTIDRSFVPMYLCIFLWPGAQMREKLNYVAVELKNILQFSTISGFVIDQSLFKQCWFPLPSLC